MTALLLALAGAALVAAGGAAGWAACTRHHDALRLDRFLHETDSHVKGDRAWKLAQRIDRWVENPERGARTLARAHRIRTSHDWAPRWGR